MIQKCFFDAFRRRLCFTAILLTGFLLTTFSNPARADSTWVFAVRISVVLQTSPPAITLNWLPDDYGSSGYSIYRKGKDDTSWGAPIATLGGSALSFTDTGVAIGSTYEYQVVEQMALGSLAYGYVLTGINTPMIENRGKLVLVTETGATASLSNELARLQSDLVGDGWQVIVHGVSSNDTPAHVKSLIVSDYHDDPAQVKALFLFGHVAIFQSGNLNYDYHGERPMPTDSFYGDIDGNWSSHPSYIPSDVELMVGRVDFFSMPGAGAVTPWPSETELLRRYLNKDHAWRFKEINVQRQALVADRFGITDNAEPRAATGYRTFEPMVGPGHTFIADVDYDGNVAQRWISLLTANSYLWTYACGGGFDTGISTMGTHGQYNDVWSTDVVQNDAHAVFFMLEGSHFGNWDVTDNIMRACLATPTMGLAVFCLAGHPHYFVHQMGLGETAGYGTRLTVNNDGFYNTWSNTFARAIYIGLLGDPSLRMEPVAPPSNLVTTSGANEVRLNWSASPDDVAGYYVYRGPSPAGPFTRLTPSLVTGTTFTDTSPANGSSYMVRAVRLQTNPSGSYYDPSQGIFVGSTNEVTPPNNPPPPDDPPPSTNTTVVVEINGPGTVTPNYNGQAMEVGKSLSMNAKAAKGFSFVSWTGSITSSVPKIKFTMEPDLTFVATFQDTTRPKLVITRPKLSRNDTNAVITLTGRASDNDAVAAVFYQVNTNDWAQADGTTDWSAANVELPPGQNNIRAYAVDPSGNVSPTNHIVVMRR